MTEPPPHRLAAAIEDAWARRASLGPATTGPDRDAVDAVLALLDEGALRVAAPGVDGWVVRQWLKQAVLLSFRLNGNAPMEGAGGAPVFDKVGMKFAGWSANQFGASGIRAVPGAVVRRSAFVAPGVVLMPCFINVGAYVDEGTMIDTWSTVGSCAQIGRNCHISGGVGIGGVLEPLQANPVIIEDDCFIGARSEVAEGVIVERGAVLSMGVFLGASTKIIDRETGEVILGRVPAYSVVVPGSLPGKALPDGTAGPSLACAVIVKRVDARTRAKTSINDLLRGVTDPLPLAQALLRCRSITPADDGAQEVLAAALEATGFVVTRLPFGGIQNLYAQRGPGRARLCFAGHTDVVPDGATASWRHDPFGGEVAEGLLFGRGACDMKGAVAAFAAAAAAPATGTLALLITGDEEGAAVDGTARVLEWLREQDKIPAFCLVGEPTSQRALGDTVKIGRRGSMNARITVAGRQGHTAYPQLAENPVHPLVAALAVLAAHRLDEGTEWFQPSNLQVTSVDVGNPAHNVIPAAATARLNIRFNDRHNEASLTEWLRRTLAELAPAAVLEVACSGEAFRTPPGPELDRLIAAITAETGIVPRRDTGGGTSDARFIARYCPVAEFGLVGATMHQTDESVPVAELRQLTAIYRAVIESFCA